MPAKPISEAKLAANRANSKNSTGPKTAQGKSRSATNALKHGLLAESRFAEHNAVSPPSTLSGYTTQFAPAISGRSSPSVLRKPRRIGAARPTSVYSGTNTDGSNGSRPGSSPSSIGNTRAISVPA